MDREAWQAVQSTGYQRVGQNRRDLACTHARTSFQLPVKSKIKLLEGENLSVYT